MQWKWNPRKRNSREGCGLHRIAIQTQNKKLKNLLPFTPKFLHDKLHLDQHQPSIASSSLGACVAWHYSHCSTIPGLLFITSIISSMLVQGFDFWILNYFLNLLGFDLSCWLWCPFDFKLIYELLISQT